MAPSPATSAAELFRWLSRRRGRRAFHPYGAGFAAELRRLDGGAVLPAAIDGEAVVRLSRSLGAPGWLPDPWGLALRVPDAYAPGRHQDLLLASSGRAPLARDLSWQSCANATAESSSSSWRSPRFGVPRGPWPGSASAPGCRRL